MSSGATDPAARPSTPPPTPPETMLTSSARPIRSPEMPRSRMRPSVRRSLSISNRARFTASTHAIQSSGSATSSEIRPINRAMPCIRSSSTSVVLSTTKLTLPLNFDSSSAGSPASWLWPGTGSCSALFGIGAFSCAWLCSRAFRAFTLASEAGMSHPDTRRARSIRARYTTSGAYSAIWMCPASWSATPTMSDGTKPVAT